MNAIGWVAAGVLLIIIIGAVNPRIGGWLLLVVVMGMVYAAHDAPRNYI